MYTRRKLAASALIALVAIGLVGCSSSVGERAASSAPGVVTIEGSVVGADAVLLQKSWAAWEKSSGITIKYQGSSDFEAGIAQEAQGNAAPDLAIFSQPGIVDDLAGLGYLQTLPSAVSANVAKNVPAQWAKYTTHNGTNYAVPLTASVNGLVYYSPKEFYKWGISIPSTWAQLLTDTKIIQQKAGITPWCEAFDAGAQSGASGASWIDDFVLRENGPDVYDQWVAHKIPFTDPRITKAFDDVGQVLLNPKYTDVAGITLATNDDDALTLSNGSCAMAHAPSSFVSSLENADGSTPVVSPNGDYWAFPLPAVKPGPIPLTGGGTFVAAFSTNPDTVKVETYLSSEAWAKTRVALGGAISPDANVGAAPDAGPLLREATDLLHNKSVVFRFDAADLMPGIVGSGSYLTGMVNWIGGTSTAKVEQSIDASWPN